MADIRVSPAVIDDFERADENPIALPWTKNWSAGGTIACELSSGILHSPAINPATSGQSFYSAESYTQDGGSIVEAWGLASGQIPQAESTRFGLCDDAAGMNGYICRCENPVGDNPWTIRKYVNGTASEIAQNSNFTLPEAGDYCLMQLTDTAVNCYYAQNGDTENWTLVVSAADTTFRSNLFLHFGGNGSNPGWEAVGGGKELELSQIYRRPGE